MKTFFSAALLLSAQARAQHVVWRAGRRTFSPANDTASFTNSSSISFAVDPTTIGQDSTKSNASPPSTQISSISTTANDVKPDRSDGGSMTSTPNNPPDRSDAIGPTNLPVDGVADGDNCGSTVTYHGSIYPTLYMTVTETFDVTLSAPNASMTETETLITPTPACKSTVIPIAQDGRYTILETVLSTLSGESTDAKSTFSTLTAPANSSETWREIGAPRPLPTPPGEDNSLEGEPDRPPQAVTGPRINVTPVVLSSVVYSDAPYTSTVIVTKKTPVPVVPQSALDPPPVFQQPKPPQDPDPAAPQNQDGNRPGGNSGPNSGGAINSIVLAAPGAGNTPLPAPQTTIANVPVAVRPASVVIGSAIVPIPVAGAEAVVTQGGVEFIVRPNEIVAPSTTVGFGPLSPVQGDAINIPPTRVTAAPGVVVEVAGSTAVVAGTTYRIVNGFSTVITVSGQRISIGPSGVGLPSTTIVPARATNGLSFTSSVGGITFTISGSIAIISGTRYGIATDSPSITTVIDGERISIGPGGIGFPSTTVRATAAEATQTSGSTGGELTSTGAGSADASIAGALQISITTVFMAVLGFAILL